MEAIEKQKHEFPILLAEDSPARLELTDMLRHNGYTVISVASGPDAVEKVSKTNNDIGIVLMDIRMEGDYDGIEAARRIQELNSDTNIIFFVSAFTRNPSYHRRVAEANLNISGWIDKPLIGENRANLLQTLDLIIDEKFKEKLQEKDSIESHAEELVHQLDTESYLLKPEQIQRVTTDISVVNKQLKHTFINDPKALWTMDPRLFEELVAELFEDNGYEVILTPERSDGGKDLYVYKKELLTKAEYLVECKRYVPPHKVGVEIARQLYGVVKSENASGGIIVTTSYFTRGAIDFAGRFPYQLNLHDFSNLTTWLKKHM